MSVSTAALCARADAAMNPEGATSPLPLDVQPMAAGIAAQVGAQLLQELLVVVRGATAPKGAPGGLAAAASPAAASGLTPREQQVLQGLGAGLSNKSIARRLGIADGTVKTHVKAILRKLGAPNRTAAVMLANRAGWLRP